MENKDYTSFKIHILSLLIQNLKSLTSGMNRKGELYIFFTHHDQLQIPFLSEKAQNQEILSIILGNEYAFKNMKLLDTAIKVKVYIQKLWQEVVIPYNAIVGCANTKMYLKCNVETEDITLKQIEKFVYISDIFEKNIAIFFKNLELNGLKKNQTIKLTFIENYIENALLRSIPHEDKLLVLIMEENCWMIKTHDKGIELSLKNMHKKQAPIKISYKAILNCLDTQSRIFFNRNIKIIEEDFEDMDFNVYEKKNLVYVNFNEILQEEKELEGFNNLFMNTKNLMDVLEQNTNSENEESNTKENKKNNIKNNLIIGVFNEDEKENE